MIIQGNTIFDSEIQFAQLKLNHGRIESISTNRSDFDSPDLKVPDGQFISPGFIDIQKNGSFGKEFKTDIDAFQHIAPRIVRFGTTSICPTITTSSKDQYRILMEGLEESGHGFARFLGYHLEGPALNPEKAGAQNANLLRAPGEIDPESDLFDRVSMFTLSPELPGANDLAQALIRRGIKIGIGHTIIDAEELSRIFDQDNMLLVHLFNAMPPLSSREPGPVGFGLSEPNSYISIIVDGIHLMPRIVRIIWNAKPDKTKILCVTDGSAVAGLDDGTYKIGERTIIKDHNTAKLPSGTLVGSVLTQDMSARNLIRYTGCSLPEAIKCVSTNPARFLGLESRVGKLAEGNNADFLVIDEEINVYQTYIGAELVYDSTSP